MELALISTDGIMFLLRWFHFLAGITWIGVLYYFNFIQGEYFKEIEPGNKTEATAKLVPRALWWFRWGAMFTWITGILMIMGTLHQGMPIHTSWTLTILFGALLGTFMWYNVWFIIWPAQKVVIASAKQVLSGGKPIADAAGRGARAMCASRTNTLFSFPMLFFMGAARHLGFHQNFNDVKFKMVAIVIGAILLIIEINAIKGKPGPMASVRGVITSGITLTVVLYLAFEILIRL